MPTAWIIQYMSPGMNGNLPKSDAESAWPHSKSGHQTLFSPAWLQAENDQIVLDTNTAYNDLTFARNDEVKTPLHDYINYISPPTETKDGRKGWKGTRYWGGNIPRLNQIKEKYDPKCFFHSGPTFGSKGCKAKKLDSVF